jgi:cytochrome c553
MARPTRNIWKGMRRALPALFVVLAPVVSLAAERPAWAFPVTDAVQPATPKQDDQPKTLTGSTKSYTAKQIDDLSNPPDWFPDLHPPMPQVVAHGTATFACGSCHLPTGTGHDESAYLAGLQASYIFQQMADFKSGARKGFGEMPAIAQALTDADFRSAAQYFASLPPRPWVRVVETNMVPKTYVAPGNIRLVLPSGGSEPIGNRLVELPADEQAALDRDPRSGFVVYTPTGSLAKGQALVTTGGGKTTACGICHAATLKGLGTMPAIAGRHGNYIVRQLYFFQDGERSGPSVALMKNVVQRLTIDDMLAIAAYLSSREP